MHLNSLEQQNGYGSSGGQIMYPLIRPYMSIYSGVNIIYWTQKKTQTYAAPENWWPQFVDPFNCHIERSQFPT